MSEAVMPKTDDGRALHMMDGEAYVVIVDERSGEEVSARIVGQLWYAIRPARAGSFGVDFMFDPAEMGQQNRSQLTITKASPSARPTCFLHGEPIASVSAPFNAIKGTPVQIDWHLAYDLMA